MYIASTALDLHIATGNARMGYLERRNRLIAAHVEQIQDGAMSISVLLPRS